MLVIPVIRTAIPCYTPLLSPNSIPIRPLGHLASADYGVIPAFRALDHSWCLEVVTTWQHSLGPRHDLDLRNGFKRGPGFFVKSCFPRLGPLRFCIWWLLHRVYACLYYIYIYDHWATLYWVISSIGPGICCHFPHWHKTRTRKTRWIWHLWTIWTHTLVIAMYRITKPTDDFGIQE